MKLNLSNIYYGFFSAIILLVLTLTLTHQKEFIKQMNIPSSERYGCAEERTDYYDASLEVRHVILPAQNRVTRTLFC